MASVSDFGTGGQQSKREPLASRARVRDARDDDDFDYDGDTVLEHEPVPAGAATGGTTTGAAEGAGPLATAPGEFVISAPAGPLPVAVGYTVYAVAFRVGADGEEEVESGAPLTAKLATEHVARGVANYKAAHGSRTLPARATHVVVNDHTGHEVHRTRVARPA